MSTSKKRDTAITESIEDIGPTASSSAWSLSVAHHPDRAWLGSRATLLKGMRVVVGRESDVFGPGTLADRRISRRHATFCVNADGVLEFEDHESHNGTQINGRRRDRGTLAPGDVVGVGGVLLLVHRAPTEPLARDDGPGAPSGVSALIAQTCAAARRLASSNEPVVIFGERGAGKDHLARFIHRVRGRAPFVILTPTTIGDAEITTTLLGTRDGPGIFESADGGTLLVDGLDSASDAMQAALRAFLDTFEVRRTGTAVGRKVDVRVLGTAPMPPRELVEAGLLSAGLADRLGLASLRVPPLRDRLEDVPCLVRERLGELGAADAWLDPLLTLALLRYAWPGNVRELRAVIHHVVESADDRKKLMLTAELATLLGAHPVIRTKRPTLPDGVLIARDGSWFAVGSEYVSLDARPTLARVLSALAAHRENERREPLTAAEVFAVAWPGERIADGPAVARVYVAISTLRKLGLRKVLGGQGGGYHLRDVTPLEIVDRSVMRGA